MAQDIDPLTQDMNIINTQIGIMEDGVDKDTLQTTYESFVKRKADIDDGNPQTINETEDTLVMLAGDVSSVADPYRKSNGGRRRKYSRRGRRSAKKRGTQRKQKRRQRRGSRRAY